MFNGTFRVFSLECKRRMVKQKVISTRAHVSGVVHHAPCVVFTPLVVSPVIMSEQQECADSGQTLRHSRPQSRV